MYYVITLFGKSNIKLAVTKVNTISYFLHLMP